MVSGVRLPHIASQQSASIPSLVIEPISDSILSLSSSQSNFDECSTSSRPSSSTTTLKDRLTLPLRLAGDAEANKDYTSLDESDDLSTSPSSPTPSPVHPYAFRPASPTPSSSLSTEFALVNSLSARSPDDQHSVHRYLSVVIPSSCLDLRLSQISRLSQLENMGILEDLDGYTYYGYPNSEPESERTRSTSDLTSDGESTTPATPRAASNKRIRRIPAPKLVSADMREIKNGAYIYNPYSGVFTRDKDPYTRFPRRLSKGSPRCLSLSSGTIGVPRGIADEIYVDKPWLDAKNNPNATRVRVAYFLTYGLIFMGFVVGALDCYFGYRRAVKEVEALLQTGSSYALNY
ncbi:hypothetical protein VKT23_008122 [Stygiomarasmius scandens]|uniref:Uncharacterized protein n=1 Tax=Marasmiellus scandens TaxID=2682957 RepID=A0ABR1JJL3_9AGAR